MRTVIITLIDVRCRFNVKSIVHKANSIFDATRFIEKVDMEHWEHPDGKQYYIKSVQII